MQHNHATLSHGFCPICAAPIDGSTPHSCPPMWQVADTPDATSYHLIFAEDAGAAACAWLQKQHQARGVYEAGTRVIYAGLYGQGELLPYRVTLEPRYTASAGRS